MASKPESESIFGHGNPGDSSSSGDRGENVDALVSDFLAQLTNISSEMKQSPQSVVVEHHPPQSAIVPNIAKEPPIPVDQPHADLLPNTKPEREEIQQEIEATLVELERGKSSASSNYQKKEPLPAPSSNSAKLSRQSTLESPARRANANAASSSNPKPVEQGWKGSDIFRTELASYRSGRRRRNMLLALAALIIAGALIYLYFFT